MLMLSRKRRREPEEGAKARVRPKARSEVRSEGQQGSFGSEIRGENGRTERTVVNSNEQYLRFG